jgi:hypothetical protein
MAVTIVTVIPVNNGTLKHAIISSIEISKLTHIFALFIVLKSCSISFKLESFLARTIPHVRLILLTLGFSYFDELGHYP